MDTWNLKEACSLFFLQDEKENDATTFSCFPIIKSTSSLVAEIVYQLGTYLDIVFEFHDILTSILSELWGIFHLAIVGAFKRHGYRTHDGYSIYSNARESFPSNPTENPFYLIYFNHIQHVPYSHDYIQGDSTCYLAPFGRRDCPKFPSNWCKVSSRALARVFRLNLNDSLMTSWTRSILVSVVPCKDFISSNRGLKSIINKNKYLFFV